MKKKIIAFGASNSQKSINKALATFAANQVEDSEVEVLDLNTFEMPIYSIDRENESGIHTLAKEFKSKIDQADGVVISFAEHNGNVSAAYKNIYDWVSRIDMNVWQNKPIFLLATSPGARGGAGVLGVVEPSVRRSNKNVVSAFSLPSFHDNFSDKITNPELDLTFRKELEAFTQAL